MINSLLDKGFTNETNTVDNVEALCPLGASGDISPLNTMLELDTESSINYPSVTYFKGDFTSMRSMIKDENLTNHVQACDNINDKWNCFHKTTADGENHFVPVKMESAVKNKKQ